MQNNHNQSQTLTFAQLSDPHLSSLQGVNLRELANKRILGYLSWRKKRRAEHRPEVLDALQRDLLSTQPDHIVVTGDLTHIGLHDEFRQARRWLESIGSSSQVTVIPGNHDTYIRSPWMHSFSHWQAYMASDEASSDSQLQPGLDQLFPSLRIRGGVAFIGLSSAIPSAPFLAIGSLGQKQLQQLAKYLKEAREAELFRVILVHHSPVPGEEKWRKRLTDAEALCEVIRQEGAELVLHGHSHRAVESAIKISNASVPVFGIPSASAIGRKAGRAAQYNLYQVSAHETGWTLKITVRGYRPDKAVFVRLQERTLEIPRGVVAAA